MGEPDERVGGLDEDPRSGDEGTSLSHHSDSQNQTLIEIEPPTPLRSSTPDPFPPTYSHSERVSNTLQPLSATFTLTGNDPDPLAVPLPSHFEDLLILHTAVERALSLHLATDGAKAASAIASASNSASTHAHSKTKGVTRKGENENFQVSIPNLISFANLKIMVEKGSNRNFGLEKFSQLIWLWTCTLDCQLDDRLGKEGNMEDEIKGLGFISKPMKELHRATGKKSLTWGLGIEITVKTNIILPNLELVNPSLPVSGPLPPARRITARDGMSIVALWSQSSEMRTEEVRKRLGMLAIREYRVSL